MQNGPTSPKRDGGHLQRGASAERGVCVRRQAQLVPQLMQNDPSNTPEAMHVPPGRPGGRSTTPTWPAVHGGRSFGSFDTRAPRTTYRRATLRSAPRSPCLAPAYAAAGAGKHGGNSGEGSLQGTRRRRGRNAALLGRSKAEWSGDQGQRGSAGVRRAHPPLCALRSVRMAAPPLQSCFDTFSNAAPLNEAWEAQWLGQMGQCFGFHGPCCRRSPCSARRPRHNGRAVLLFREAGVAGAFLPLVLLRCCLMPPLPLHDYQCCGSAARWHLAAAAVAAALMQCCLQDRSTLLLSSAQTRLRLTMCTNSPAPLLPLQTA